MGKIFNINNYLVRQYYKLVFLDRLLKKSNLTFETSKKYFELRHILVGRENIEYFVLRLTSITFHRLQNYLREQPDNIKSVNLVAETTKFLNILYGSINHKSIDLITQVFETLVEFTSVSSISWCPVYFVLSHGLNMAVMELSQLSVLIVYNCSWSI